jgi:uncharacterized protein (TIGR02646 family)
MIHIKRMAEPDYFKSPPMRKEFDAAKDFYEIPPESRGQRRFEFKAYRHAKIREPLVLNFNNKCAICETPLIRSSGEMDHLRPKGGSYNLNKKFDPDHYWWLCYEWRNHYILCNICSRSKKNNFPVEGKRCRLLAPYEEVLRERSLLVDPCNDRPEEHFRFNKDGSITPLTKKGETTIEIFALHRVNLVSERKKIATRAMNICNAVENVSKNLRRKEEANSSIKVTLKKISESAQKMCDPTAPFSAVAMSIFDNWERTSRHGILLRDLTVGRSRLFNPVSGKIMPIKVPTKFVRGSVRKKEPQKLFLQKAMIKNFKSIEDLTIQFPSYEVVREMSQSSETTHDQYEPWLMLLGENGVGKSSFLQAMALTLMGKNYLKRVKLKADNILRHNTKSGFVKIYHEQSIRPISIKFSRGGVIISNYETPNSYLLGYGSTRLPPTKLMKEEKVFRKIKVKNMFSPDVSLADSCEFILDVHKRSVKSKKFETLFHAIGRAIRDLLLLTGTEEMKVIDHEVYIDRGELGKDKLEELSDGYKSIVALTVDIIKTLWKDNAMFDAAQGIVLLDEIGTHLHPRWRMQVVKKFRNVFPSLQFIVTTHDPLCLRGLKKGEIIVFDRQADRKVFVIDDLPDSSEYRVDQLLTSPFFGLYSVVDPALEKEFNEYYSLLRKAQPSDEEKERIKVLQNDLQPKLHIGNSWREELIYKAVDEVIANSDIKTPTSFTVSKESDAVQPTTIISATAVRTKAEEEVRSRVREILQQKEPL